VLFLQKAVRYARDLAVFFKLPGWGQVTVAVVVIGCFANYALFVLPPPLSLVEIYLAENL